MPTFTCANVPDCVKFTTSGSITPTNVPSVTLATFVPSYGLFVVVAPVTVNGLAVIANANSPLTTSLHPEPINFAFIVYVPTLVGGVAIIGP